MAIKTEPANPPTVKESIEVCKFEDDDKDTKQIRSTESSPSKKRKLGVHAERWTEVQSKLLIELRATGHSFQEIIDMGVLAGRTKRALELQATSKKREMTEIFTTEKDAELKEEYEKYEKNVWNNIGGKMGMSAGGCRKRAVELGLVKKG